MTEGSPEVTLFKRPPHNLRLKLSARGGRSIREQVFLIAAAAGRSLSASRYAAPGLKTKLLYSI